MFIYVIFIKYEGKDARMDERKHVNISKFYTVFKSFLSLQLLCHSLAIQYVSICFFNIYSFKVEFSKFT